VKCEMEKKEPLIKFKQGSFFYVIEYYKASIAAFKVAEGRIALLANSSLGK
jgi:hypothetical protein